MSSTSFLPEDYVAQQAERRTNIICLSLFALVMATVFGVFILSSRQSDAVKADQQEIGVRYEQAAHQINQLTTLEQQESQMLEKAELASALVERVPRSILFAELINRMPPNLGLLEFELKSTKIKAAIDDDERKVNTGKAQRAKTKAEAAKQVEQVQVPKYMVKITMVGAAPSDLEVSRYIASLDTHELLKDVTLEYSEETEIDGTAMREFRINMLLDEHADVRHIDPLLVPRNIRNPMKDEVNIDGGGSLMKGLGSKLREAFEGETISNSPRNSGGTKD